MVVSLSQLLIALLFNSKQKSAIIIPGIVLLLCAYSLVQNSAIALFLPPVLISATLLWLFARTLRSGREALITRFARTVFKEQDPQVLRYTRRVTQLWSLFFIAMLMETILLALFAPLEIWSLFANILNYLFIALLFLLEFGYRRLHFPQKSSPKELIQQFRSANWSELLKGNS